MREEPYPFIRRLSKRYLQNARETLRKAGIDRIIDFKYLSEASETDYLADLKALKFLSLWQRLISPKNPICRLKEVKMYDYYLEEVTRIGKDKGQGPA